MLMPAAAAAARCCCLAAMAFLPARHLAELRQDKTGTEKKCMGGGKKKSYATRGKTIRTGSFIWQEAKYNAQVNLSERRTDRANTKAIGKCRLSIGRY